MASTIIRLVNSDDEGFTYCLVKKCGADLGTLFRKDPALRWNVIDADARVSKKTRFTMPDSIRDVSLNEIYRQDLPTSVTDDVDRVSNYLLCSSAGAITLWHHDFSHTSVFYTLVKGTKTFFLVRPTDNNNRIWRAYQMQDKRDAFFGGHPDLDGGGCVKVVLTERQAILMPGGMLHAVATHGLSVALGINFIHWGQFVDAVMVHTREKYDGEKAVERYPHFPVLAYTVLIKAVRGLDGIIRNQDEIEELRKVWRYMQKADARQQERNLQRLIPSLRISSDTLSDLLASLVPGCFRDTEVVNAAPSPKRRCSSKEIFDSRLFPGLPDVTSPGRRKQDSPVKSSSNK